MNSTENAFTELVEVMTKLRSAQGCPWDREQDHNSLKPYLLEEAYEALEAIDAAFGRNTSSSALSHSISARETTLNTFGILF